MHRGGSDRNDRKRKDRLALTQNSDADNIASRLSNARPEQTLASRLLSPLLRGKPVILELDDPRLPKRKRIDKPLLFITPVTVYGRLSSKIMVALQSHGCEVIDTLEHIKPIALYRLGINMRLSIQLADELNRVFKTGDTHGNDKT